MCLPNWYYTIVLTIFYKQAESALPISDTKQNKEQLYIWKFPHYNCIELSTLTAITEIFTIIKLKVGINIFLINHNSYCTCPTVHYYYSHFCQKMIIQDCFAKQMFFCSLQKPQWQINAKITSFCYDLRFLFDFQLF